jgi:hypothetical protein
MSSWPPATVWVTSSACAVVPDPVGCGRGCPDLGDPDLLAAAVSWQASVAALIGIVLGVPMASSWAAGSGSPSPGPSAPPQPGCTLILAHLAAVIPGRMLPGRQLRSCRGPRDADPG